MNRRLLKKYSLPILIILFSFFLELIYLNRVRSDLNELSIVFINGQVCLEREGKFYIDFGKISSRYLFLELEYLNPGIIEKPSLLFNGQYVESRKSSKKGLTRTDYFELSSGLLRSQNSLTIEFESNYPQDLGIQLKNFQSKSPSGGLLLLSSKDRARFKLFSWDSPFRLLLFISLILIANFLISRFLKISSKYMLIISNVFIPLSVLACGAFLFLPLMDSKIILISQAYFFKIIIFSFFLFFTFALYQNRNLYQKQMPHKLVFYFTLVLLLSFEFALIDLPQVSSKIAVIGDLILITASIRLFKDLFSKAKEGGLEE